MKAINTDGSDNTQSISQQTNTISSIENSSVKQKKKRKRRGGNRRDQSSVVRDSLTALALCHNVTPTFPDPDDRNIVEFQASSPDEIALVKFATSMDMKLLDRDQNKILIQNAVGIEEEY